MNTTHHTGTELRRSITRLVTGTAIGLSALSIAMAAPAAAKGPHPGPVIDRPEPTSSVSAQTNAGRTSTAPMTPAGRVAPGAIPRSQPAVSINAQQYTGGAVDPAATQIRKTSDSIDDPGDTARRAEVRMPTMPGGLTPADAGRLFGGMAGASK
ncbi:MULTISPECIES: hypothetical protein [unclassified Mycobacterium]|uniref:hypothetical protein n=1 Tax=unclassified Mycobacterium TaxID=2642494 RepID=UPI0004907572|nr:MULTISPECIES: hypothetical protein [unclassified Mycobacterium]SEB26378.1 hypothetical protein SAMN04488580_12013 [Mycobacterium sp. 283mftsu]